MGEERRALFGRRLFVAVALTVVAASLFSAGTARGATLAYVRDNNVWVESPDGSLRRAITTAGTASSPYTLGGIADNGTVLAAYGSPKTWFLFNPDGTLRKEGPNVVPMHQCGSAIGSIGPLVPVLHPTRDLVAYNYICNYPPPTYGTETRLALDDPKAYTPGTSTLDLGTSLYQPTWFGDRLVAESGGTILVQRAASAPYQTNFDDWLVPAAGNYFMRTEVARAQNRFLVEDQTGSAATDSTLLGTYTGTPPSARST